MDSHVMLFGLSDKISISVIKDLLKECGTIIRVGLTSENNNATGFVRFADEENAQQALLHWNSINISKDYELQNSTARLSTDFQHLIDPTLLPETPNEGIQLAITKTNEQKHSLKNQSRSKSPQKQRRTRSPENKRRTRSPQKQRRSRSPHNKRRSRSPHSKRRSRSPVKQRRSRSPHERSRHRNAGSTPLLSSNRTNRASPSMRSFKNLTHRSVSSKERSTDVRKPDDGNYILKDLQNRDRNYLEMDRIDFTDKDGHNKLPACKENDPTEIRTEKIGFHQNVKADDQRIKETTSKITTPFAGSEKIQSTKFQYSSQNNKIDNYNRDIANDSWSSDCPN